MGIKLKNNKINCLGGDEKKSLINFPPLVYMAVLLVSFSFPTTIQL